MRHVGVATFAEEAAPDESHSACTKRQVLTRTVVERNLKRKNISERPNTETFKMCFRVIACGKHVIPSFFME